MRLDLKIDDSFNKDFSEIGLVEVKIKDSRNINQDAS